MTGFTCRLHGEVQRAAADGETHISKVVGLAFSDTVGGCALINHIARGLPLTTLLILSFACLSRLCYRGIGRVPCRAGGVPALFDSDSGTVCEGWACFGVVFREPSGEMLCANAIVSNEIQQKSPSWTFAGPGSTTLHTTYADIAFAGAPLGESVSHAPLILNSVYVPRTRIYLRPA